MKAILNKLFAHESLSQEEAKNVLLNISEGKYNPSQVAVFMGVYMMRSVTVDELLGFRNALLELCVKPGISSAQSIDLCGTGGDGKDSFNISTTSAFVVSGAGYRVVKHGNYGVSSMCGSSNVLEHLGYQFTNDSSKLQAELDSCNLCFLHAPLFHPAMKFVAPIRKELGVKTFFNMLGPLVNPARPSHQCVGVFSLELARLYNYLFEKEDRSYCIVHGLDGYDEVSLTDECLVIRRDSEELLSANDFGLEACLPESLHGGADVKESGKILIDVLDNCSDQSKKDVVIANSALAIKCFESEKSIEECGLIARESIESGKAKTCFDTLIQRNQS